VTQPAGFIIVQSIELREEVSSDSCRHNILLRPPLDGVPFCLKYHIVGTATGRSAARSRLLDPRRVYREPGGERCDGRRHDLLSNGSSEPECTQWIGWNPASSSDEGKSAKFKFG